MSTTDGSRLSGVTLTEDHDGVLEWRMDLDGLNVRLMDGKERNRSNGQQDSCRHKPGLTAHSNAVNT